MLPAGAIRSIARRLRRTARAAVREARFEVEVARHRISARRTLAAKLGNFGKKVYSQNDEDGVLEYLFEVLGTKRRFFVEIGVGPAWTPTGHLSIEDAGLECNCRLLRERGWGGVLIDGSSYPERFRVVQEFVTVENINALFAKYAVPKDLDLFSLDVDGNDYWLWKALDHEPRVVLIEYNASIPIDQSKTIPYDPGFSWSGTGHSKYYGASLLAFDKLAKAKGYALVYANGVNAFFVRSELLPNRDEFRYEQLYRFREAHKPLRGDEIWVEV